MIFDIIKNINPFEINNWHNKVYLTIDIDWASDDVLNYTIDIFEEFDIPATWFVTHNTSVLSRLRENQKFELGIHPNFNYLLSGDFRYGKNFGEVISFYKKIAPEAISLRSHSLTQSGLFLDTLSKHNIKFECNTFIPFETGINLIPWQHTDKIIKVPHFWEDDVRHIYSNSFNILPYINTLSLKVFAFHPIHIFLNTEDINRYIKAKLNLFNFAELKKSINDKRFGTKDYLINLIKNIING